MEGIRQEFKAWVDWAGSGITHAAKSAGPALGKLASNVRDTVAPYFKPAVDAVKAHKREIAGGALLVLAGAALAVTAGFAIKYFRGAPAAAPAAPAPAAGALPAPAGAKA